MKPNSFLVLFLIAMTMSLPIKAIGNDGKGRTPPGVQVYKDGSAVVESISGGTHEGPNGVLTAVEYLAIYTKNDAQSVAGFYRKSLGINPVTKSYGQSFYLGMDVDDYGRYTVPVTVDIVEASRRKDQSIKKERLFGAMEDDMRESRMAGTSKHSSTDVKKLKQRYLYLIKRWYPDFDVREKLHNCEQGMSFDSEDYVDQSEVDAAKIQALVAQGRYEEAGSIVDKRAEAGMAEQNEAIREKWDDWINCLDEIDLHSYRTLIMISKVSDQFRPETANGQEDVNSRLNEKKSGHSDRESEKESSNTSDELMNKGMDKLKGMFGL